MSQSIYNETLNCFVNLIKTTATSNKALFDGLLTVGTNSYSLTETQIAPSATFSGTTGVAVLMVFCDGPLSITFNNGLTSYTTIVNSLMIVPGTIGGYTLTNNGSNTVNVKVILA